MLEHVLTEPWGVVTRPRVTVLNLGSVGDLYGLGSCSSDRCRVPGKRATDSVWNQRREAEG